MNAPRILLGVSGGIAAYKAAELTRQLIKAGAEVQVMLTGRAEAFITPLTLATLSGHRVWRDEFPAEPGPAIGHIELGRWASALVIAPATANILARLAHGLGDDLVSSVALVFQGPLVVAPAMNPRMWDHPETRANVLRLRQRGVVIVEPEEGILACGDEGAGRLAAVDAIARAALRAAARTTSLQGKTVLISAGPTHEPIDPVRFIGNRSTGKMGFALAAAAHARGAKVWLVAGPTALEPPFGVDTVRVETALEMQAALQTRAAAADLIVMTAAVADHRAETVAPTKLEQKNQAHPLPLVPNPDILAALVAQRVPGQVIVGFAAETGDLIAKATAKRVRKGCDLLVANDVTAARSGFGVDTNQVVIVDSHGQHESWPLLGKRELAERLLDRITLLLSATAVRR